MEERRAEENRVSCRGEVELWAMDEHRVGLKPILRRVWAKRGERPQVQVRPRYEWLWIYGFVCPETGEAEFWLATEVSSELFSAVTRAFVRKRAARGNALVLLVLDRAGWHVSEASRQLEAELPLELVHLPSYSPELMPVEQLWELCDEPVANTVFESLQALEAAVAEQCLRLTEEPERIRSRTLYHWWPGGADHTLTT